MDTKALRQKILDLAIRGKLVPQNPEDEPASVLLERIRAEKEQMVKDGKLNAKEAYKITEMFSSVERNYIVRRILALSGASGDADIAVIQEGEEIKNS